MQDVRNDLGVMSLRWKIEKRVLQRIGHIMRMKDDRIVKAVVLGWMEELESEKKVPGKKRKTVLYWKGLLKQAGLDYTRIDLLTKDRKEWKAIVNERMRHLEKWERRRGKKVPEESGNRDVVVEEVGYVCEECNKVCKNKAGLTVHRRRMHGRSDQKVTF